jgi:hypothetical protein
MALLNRMKLLFRVSRPLSWTIGPSIYIAGFMHSGTFPQLIPGVLFAIALSFPACLSEYLEMLRISSCFTEMHSYLRRE